MGGAWTVTTNDLRDVATALRFEEDGGRLRRQLGKELRTAVQPAVAAAKGRLMAGGSTGISHRGEPLRGAIARQVKTQVRLSGRSAGVRVRVSTRGMPRGFTQAPRRLNRKAGWRHPVYGNRDVWVRQAGPVGWFDDPMQEHAEQYRAGVARAVRDMAARISKGA